MVLNKPNGYLPYESHAYRHLEKQIIHSAAIVISGLPGSGKSLLLNEAYRIATSVNKKATVIQWDQARKAFETEDIQKKYPLGDGVIHNTIKLSIGKWLISTLSSWLSNYHEKMDLLIIEAPLVGHRFIELAKVQGDQTLEDFLTSARCNFTIPIPSIDVRQKIESDRASQVSEGAQTWMGAKPSVMLKIWKMVCQIANELGKEVDVETQPPYDPEIYHFVFQNVLKHRNYQPLFINEIFDVEITDEKQLHDLPSLSANPDEALSFVQEIEREYPQISQINRIVSNWYLQ